MLNRISLIVAVALAALSTACAPKGGGDYEGPRLVVFGDSLSFGPQTFSYMLARRLALPIANHAHPGTILENGEQYNRLMTETIRPHDTVIFLSGYNNMRIFGTYAPAIGFYKAYLKDVIIRLRDSGAQVYVGTTMTVLPELEADPVELRRVHGEGSAAAALAFANAIKDVVAEHGGPNVHVVDVNALYHPALSDFKQPDLVHPDYGYTRIADLFESAIRN